MTADARPYVVLLADGTRRIVDAQSANRAYIHVADGYIKSVTKASGREVADAIAEGLVVEKASELQ